LYFPGFNDQSVASGARHITARPQHGNAVLQVIFVLGILIMAIYFVADRIQGHRNVVLQTGSVVKARFALQSLVDYMYFAVQRRYCLTDTLLAEPFDRCQLKTGVTGTTGRSVERVLLSDEQAKTMLGMVNTNNINLGLEIPKPIANENVIRAVNRVDIRVKAKDILPTHPLYNMIDPLYQVMKQELKSASKFKTLDLVLRVEIQRDDGSNVPRTGNEVYFRIKVSLEDGTNKVLSVNNTRMEVTSYGTVFPRELGSFSLMIARDLRMDGGNADANGDVALPVFAGKTEGPGLVFMSPVFVNRNVHLPFVTKADGGQKASDKKYSPITFADRVVLGRGKIHQGDQLYQPESAGGRDSALWTDNKLFGGFKMGVLVDGFLDKGLSVFGQTLLSTPVSDEFMRKCNARYDMLTNLSKVQASEFYGNLKSAGAGVWEYRLGFTEGNSFKRGGDPFFPMIQDYWIPGLASRVPDSPDPNAKEAAVMAEIKLGNTRKVSLVRLSRTSSAEFVAPVASQAYEDKLLLDKTNAEALPATTAEIDARAAAIAAADAAIAAFNQKKANPGKIKLTFKTVTKATREQTNILDLAVEITNPGSFLDETMPEPRLVAPQIQLLAYDGIHKADYDIVNGTVVAPVNFVASKKTRFLNFNFDAGNSLLAPDGFATAYGAAPLSPAVPNDDFDYAELDQQCADARNASTGQSFGAAEWNIDFAQNSTFKSWNYADDDGKLPTDTLSGANDTAASAIEFTEAGSLMGTEAAKLIPFQVNPPDGEWKTGRDEFKVRSISPSCRIKSKARLVTGFFTCHELFIERRAPGFPLYIIGSFIVRKIYFTEVNGTSHSDAAARDTFKEGVHWMSIYHPEATTHLRNSAVLAPKLNPNLGCTDGASATQLPIWASSANKISRVSDIRACNVVALRSKSNPMQWTAVDPDCGLLPDGSATVCKNHPVNFFVMEQARGGGP